MTAPTWSSLVAGIATQRARRRLRWTTLVVLGVVLSLATVPQAAGADGDAGLGTWQAVAPLLTARTSDHTATLLPDGRVLVVGGLAPDDVSKGALTAAEVYDPVADRWSQAGSISAARQYHQATALADGRVLVTGGYLESKLVAVTEVFDPKAGAWHSSGTMAEGRIGHTATRLRDGKVLVAGGLVFGPDTRLTFATSSELYDPATGTWTATAPMPAPRAEHAATLLSDGKVLVTGGQGVTGRIVPALHDALVYDPVTTAWSTVPQFMLTARAAHTAILLDDGTVLIAGGSTQKEHGGGGSPTSAAELYDPVAGAFLPAPSLTHPRLAHTATLLPDKRILVVGGLGREDERRGAHAVVSSELYDPAAKRWLPTASPIGPPASEANRDMRVWLFAGNHTATLLSAKPCGTSCGDVLVIGGDRPASPQLFEPPGNARTSGAPGTGRGGVPVGAGAGLAALALAAAAVIVLRARRRTSG